MSKIQVRLKKSLISEKEPLRRVVKALGLRRINDQKTHSDNNCIRGMVNKVKHLVEYKLISG